MGITHRLNSWVHDLLTPIAVSEADIREELECHVELRSLKNMAAGMSPEEARLDAEGRFGDFESNVRNCYRASLGVRIWLSYLQWTFFTFLVGAVVWLATSMFQMQSEYESKIDSLRDRLASQESGDASSISQGDNLMEVRQWNFPVSQQLFSATTEDAFVDKELVTPKGAWCDWSSLD